MGFKLNKALAGLAATAGLCFATAAQAVPFAYFGGAAANVDSNPGTNVFLNAGAGIIGDLNVSVHIEGVHMEDFDLFLTSPGGTVVHFRTDFAVDQPFQHIDNPLNATFDDEALTLHGAQVGGAVGTFQAFNLLSAFDGEQLLGVWTLTISDLYIPGEGNTLISWSISGESVPEPGVLSLLGLAALGLVVARRRV